MIDVAVLYARRDSVYKTIPGLDVFDEDRDARTYAGRLPVVAHPPCRAWGRFAKFAKPAPHEKDLARHAVAKVRELGGVLEHPATSDLWEDQGLPSPARGARDDHGGFTLHVDQLWWGHPCQKSTWLYVVGLEPREVPPFVIPLVPPTHVIESGRKNRRSAGGNSLPYLPKSGREKTPLEFAEFLVALARKASK